MMITIALVGAVGCWLILRQLITSPIAKLFADEPNDRSLHAEPVPRLGGIAVVASIIGFGLVWFAWLTWSGTTARNPDVPIFILFACLLVLGLLGIADDRYGLSPLFRGAVQICCAAGIVLTAGNELVVITGSESLTTVALFTSVAILATKLVVVCWCANLFNFMDGSDGIAGVMGITGFGALALLAPANSITAGIAVLAAASCAGFLTFNWHPARVFLGDAGSVPLGFLAASLTIFGANNDYWPIWLPIASFLPFVFDATVTLILRVIRGHKPWQAHREHAYQRLILAGYSHPQIAIAVGSISILCSVVAATNRYQNGFVCFTLWTVIIVMLAGIYWLALRSARSDHP